MKLESVSIQNFRSVENTSLFNCGGFNVLIGKNNSGKSTILAAISTFFRCIQAHEVVTIEPQIGQPIDFFQRAVLSPLEIKLTFSLLLADRDALIRDIVTEAPQVKNAADGLDPSLHLSATLKIMPGSSPFGVVSRLALEKPAGANDIHPKVEYIICSISQQAAIELQTRFVKARTDGYNAEVLRTFISRFDEDDWRMLNRDPDITRTQARNLARFRTSDMSPELFQTIEKLVRQSASYSDVLNTIQSMIATGHETSQGVLNEPLQNKIGTFAGEEASVPGYVKNLLHNISEMNPLYLTERRTPIGTEEAARLVALKVTRGKYETFSRIQETISALLGVRVDAVQSDVPSSRGQSIPELDVDDFLVQVNGSGIREALRLILDYEFEKPKLLLVEEPEVHLHPALERSMMQYLKHISPDCQVFITTHSTNFLDTAEMNNVYLVSKETSTVVQLLNLEQAEAQIPRELGIRLSSLFMFDRLVFVEGPSDEAILRELASTVGMNLSQSNVGFITMGGVRNLGYFSAQAIMTFLMKRQVKMWFLIDRDEKDAPEVHKIEEAFKDKAHIHILEKRELENYLIRPSAIERFIALKKQLAGSRSEHELPDKTDITRKVEECAENLKQTVIDKRVAKVLCSPIYPSQKRVIEDAPETPIADKVIVELQRLIESLQEAKNSAEETARKEANNVDGVWQAKKLDIVPGDVLLDSVCQQYGVRFIKERDGGRLASQISEGEIDTEIKTLLREIAGQERC